MKKILVVDDQSEITRIYQRLLEKEGYPVIEANDSHRATNLLVTQRDVELVLLDLHMPGTDGRTLFEVIKQYDPDIRIIVTSVFSLDEQKRMIRAADDYYDKSQGVEVLLAKVQKVLERDEVTGYAGA